MTGTMGTNRESQSMASTGSATSTSRMIPATAGSVPQRPNLNRNNRRSLYHPPSAAGGNGAPEIYWSEGGTPSGTQNDTYTFYREPTPEPEERRGEKRGAGVGVHPGDDGDLSDFEDRRICGMKRIWFWGVIALALVVIIAIGVGVGVGVGLSTPSPAGASGQDSGTQGPSSGENGSETSTMDQATSIRSPAPTSTGSGWRDQSDDSTESTATSPTVDPAFPTVTSSGSLTCPESNYTLYAVPGSPIRFLRLCDVDITNEHATDIRTVPTESMAECMRNCAGTFGCQGAGWGQVRSDAGTQFWCWLKGDLGSEFKELRGWEFAVMQ